MDRKIGSIGDFTLFLRQASPADIDVIMEIEKDAFARGIQESRQIFLERMEVFSEGFLLLEQRNAAYKKQVVGYFSSELWEKKICRESAGKHFSIADFALGHSAKKSHHSGGNTLYASSVGILSQCRGQGLGKLLFNQALEQICTALPAIKQIVLLVNEEWVTARSIYEKSGFCRVVELPRFFADSSGALIRTGIVMTKAVP